MAERTVYMTSFDLERIESLIQTHRSSSPKRKAQIDRLEKELDRAVIVEPKDIPADVVTMNTKLRLRDETSGEEMVLSLVFPADADLEKNRVSVLAPIGTALLGYRVGRRSPENPGAPCRSGGARGPGSSQVRLARERPATGPLRPRMGRPGGPVWWAA